MDAIGSKEVKRVNDKGLIYLCRYVEGVHLYWICNQICDGCLGEMKDGYAMREREGERRNAFY